MGNLTDVFVMPSAFSQRLCQVRLNIGGITTWIAKEKPGLRHHHQMDLIC